MCQKERGQSRTNIIDIFLLKTQSAKQTKISFAGDMMQKAIKIGRTIFKISHHNHISPNLANSPYYKAMIDTVAEVGLEIKPSTPCEINGKFLDMEHEKCKNFVEQHMKSDINMVVR